MTSASEPTFAELVVLALVGRGGAGAHDCAKALETAGQIYGGLAPSQVYAAARRLHERGYLSAETRPGRKRARPFYQLTPDGEAVLRAHLRRPSPYPTMRQEATLRLLAGDLLDEADIVASITAMRAEIDRIEAAIAEMEARAEALPHRHKYLMLQHRLGRMQAQTLRDWIDLVEASLGPGASDAEPG